MHGAHTARPPAAGRQGHVQERRPLRVGAEARRGRPARPTSAPPRRPTAFVPLSAPGCRAQPTLVALTPNRHFAAGNGFVSARRPSPFRSSRSGSGPSWSSAPCPAVSRWQPRSGRFPSSPVSGLPCRRLAGWTPARSTASRPQPGRKPQETRRGRRPARIRQQRRVGESSHSPSFSSVQRARTTAVP